MAKRKLHKLTQDFIADFILVGIASHENDYRLSWSLNNKLDVKFVKTDDLLVYNAKHKLEIAYSRYFLESDPDLNAYLISNKSENGFLLPKYKNIDFVLKLSAKDMQLIGEIVDQIKRVDIVITAFILEDVPERLEKFFDF